MVIGERLHPLRNKRKSDNISAMSGRIGARCPVFSIVILEKD